MKSIYDNFIMKEIYDKFALDQDCELFRIDGRLMSYTVCVAVSYKGIKYTIPVGRIIYYLKTNEMPNGLIDHIDREGRNQHPDNIRQVNGKESALNRSTSLLHRQNKEGFYEMSFSKKRERYTIRQYIGPNENKVGRGKFKYIAVFKVKQEAIDYLKRLREPLDSLNLFEY